MPNGKYDFEYDEPVSIPLDPETTLRTMLTPDQDEEPVSDEPSSD